MLINTVILFLSDALPVVIMTALLLALSAKQTLHWFVYGIAISIVTTFTLINSVDFIAQWFDSTGLELLFSSGYILIYFFIIGLLINKYLFLNTMVWQVCAFFITLLVMSLNGTNFLVYITGYWSQADALQSLLIGMVLGAGICMSIGVLLYFFVIYCDRNLSVYTVSLLFLLYGAGQLIQATNLLLQIDILPTSSVLWDMNIMINEKSEIGHFLNALFGYDASPTISQALIYVVAIIIPMALFIIKPFIKPKTPRQTMRQPQEVSS